MGILSFLGTAIGAGAGFLIGGPAGAKLGATLGGLGGSALTKKQPGLTVGGSFGGTAGTAGGPIVPGQITTPSLSFSNVGGNVGIRRTAPAFIPGQTTSLGPTQFGQTPSVTQGPEFGKFGGGFGTGARTFIESARPIGPTTGGVDPRLQEEQDLRQQAFELNPFLEAIKKNIDIQRGQVAGVQAGTEQLGQDVRAFREGFGIDEESLGTPAGNLQALSALARGLPLDALEQSGTDLQELAEQVGLTDVSQLREAIEQAKIDTGAPTTEAGISMLQQGIQQAQEVDVDFQSPLDQLRQAQSELDPGTADFNKLRENIANFRKNLEPEFNKSLQTSLQQIEDEKAIASGDLREQLSRRRIAGSSFAQDTLRRTEATFERREDQTRAEFFDKITIATSAAFGLEGEVLNTQIGQRLNAASQRAIFAAEEAGIIDTGIGRQLEKAGILAEGGDRLAQIGLLQSREDLNRATSLAQIASNEIDAEIKIAATQGQLAAMGADILSDAFSQRLAALQTSGNLSAQEATVLAQQSSLALQEAALTGQLFELEADVLRQQVANIGVSMGLNEQDSRNFGDRMAVIKEQQDILNQTTQRELEELRISGNIATAQMNTNAEIGKTNAELAILEAKARGESQAGFVDLFASAAPGILEFGRSLFGGSGSDSSRGIVEGGTGLF